MPGIRRRAAFTSGTEIGVKAAGVLLRCGDRLFSITQATSLEPLCTEDENERKHHRRIPNLTCRAVLHGALANLSPYQNNLLLVRIVFKQHLFTNNCTIISSSRSTSCDSWSREL